MWIPTLIDNDQSWCPCGMLTVDLRLAFQANNADIMIIGGQMWQSSC